MKSAVPAWVPVIHFKLKNCPVWDKNGLKCEKGMTMSCTFMSKVLLYINFYSIFSNSDSS